MYPTSTLQPGARRSCRRSSRARALTCGQWESCGATWVTIEELSHLRDEHYRSADPAVLFPAVARGELLPASLDTAAWASLQAAVARLTSGDLAGGEQALREAWPLVLEAYPAQVRTQR